MELCVTAPKIIRCTESPLGEALFQRFVFIPYSHREFGGGKGCGPGAADTAPPKRYRLVLLENITPSFKLGGLDPSMVFLEIWLQSESSPLLQDLVRSTVSIVVSMRKFPMSAERLDLVVLSDISIEQLESVKKGGRAFQSYGA